MEEQTDSAKLRDAFSKLLFAFNIQYTFHTNLTVFKIKRSECIRLLPMNTFPNLLYIHNMVFWVVA